MAPSATVPLSAVADLIFALPPLRIVGVTLLVGALVAAAALAGLWRALKRAEEHHRVSVALSPQISWLASPGGQMIEVSPRWTEVTGLSARQSARSGWIAALHPDDAAGVLASWQRAVRAGEAADIRFRLRTRDGSYRWVRARASPRRLRSGRIVQWYGGIEDIQSQVDAETALSESEEFLRLASLATNDAIWDWRRGAERLRWGPAMGSWLGYPEAAAGTPIAWCVERIHPDDRERTLGGLRAALDGDAESWSAELRFRRADGSYADILSRGRIIRDDAGTAIRCVGAMLDISERKRIEDRLRWTAEHDALTGLANRGCFDALLQSQLASAGTRQVALVLVDIDNLKAVNDAWGHAGGDALLRAFASRLGEIAPDGATAARLGGDEFALVIPDLASRQAALAAIDAVAESALTSFTFEGAAIDCTASIGAAVWPRDGRGGDALLRSADLALYDAKAAGRGLTRIFEPEMRVAVERRSSMISLARAAISDDRIVPFYQAKVDLRGCGIVGFEALLRWHHHRRGLQPPRGIDAAFGDMELAARLTDRMIECVIEDAREWLDRGVDFKRIAINGSAPDFARGDFAERLLERFARAGIPADRFELEVTESVFVGQIADKVERILGTLSAAGTTIALDDFGTGYASLSHIKQFPVDTLKIDQSFISARAVEDPNNLAIVRAVIGLGHSLGISTVAEGIETLAQANLLRREGCDAGQGYLFGRAIAASRVPKLIREFPQRWTAGPAGIVEAGVEWRETAD